MKVLVFCGLAILTSYAFASATDTLRRQVDAPVVTDQEVNRMDSLIESWFSTNPAIAFNKSNYESLEFSATDTPRVSPEVIAERIAMINTSIPLVYNSTVQSFIDLYVIRRRAKVSEMLTIGQQYFPMIEEELDRQGMPMELKYVAVIESALNTHAVSKAGATGLWQMMYGTGKLMGLQIDTYVDERRDPYLATQAGIAYLKKMHAIYDDWLLAIAAYNCGPGNVNKALRKAGGGDKTFWDIWKYLPAETRSYVPIFIAATYSFEYHEEHNIQPSTFSYQYEMLDTVMITRKLTLEKIAPSLGMTVDEIKLYNPGLKTNTIPGSPIPFPLRLPMDAVAMWISNQEALYASMDSPAAPAAKTIAKEEPVAKTETNKEQPAAKAATTSDIVTVNYIVKKNDNLGYISDWFDCTVTDLKKWNGLSSTKIVPGQRLKIKVPAEKEETYAAINTMSFSEKQKLTPVQMVETGEKKEQSEIVYYTVRPGDTLWSISKKYPENSIQTLQELNSIGQNETLKVGAKIKIVQ
jgi:membrane-bound lytic murein transglycosylase D